MLLKKALILSIISLISFSAFSSMLTSTPDNMRIPSRVSFLNNIEYMKSFKNKKITTVEYITDPLIMYASLWGCFGLTLPLWETDGSKYDLDGNRGFNKLALNQHVFGDRLKMEPFATDRTDPVTKEWNGTAVFRGDIYAKNIIEPVYFTYLGLYMRAKNYHPAIMITEIILLSVVYEFTIRPFYLNASFEQLIKNPAVGLVAAILLDELSNFLLSTPYKVLHVLAYFFNPFNALPNARIHPMLFFDPYKKTANIEAVVRF